MGLPCRAAGGVAHGFGCGRSEASDLDLVLLEFGKVLEQRVDTRGAEEEQHVVVKRFVGAEIVADGAVHHGLGVVDAVAVKHVEILLVHVGHGVEKFLLGVLGECWQQVVEFAGGAVEYFALAIYYIFLQIEGYGLGGAEIFQGVGYRVTHLFTQTEEMVYGGACCENYSCKIRDRDLGLTELFGRQAFDFDEWTEFYFDTVFLGYFVVWRFF